MAAVATAAFAAAPAGAVDDHMVSFPMDYLPGPYSPSDTEIAAGDTVTFQGTFGYHPLVWTDGDFATTETGGSAQFAFPKPGLYRFHCQIHGAAMAGSVHVPGNQFATPDFGFAPAAPKTGDTVTFTVAAVADPDGTIARYEWDLDGNGSFETTTTGPQATRAYTAAGTFAVQVRYVDDGHEASPARAHDVAVSASTQGGGGTSPPGSPGGGGGGAGGGGDGTGPGADVTAPTARLAPAALRFHGRRAVLRVKLDERARATISLSSRGTVLARGAGALRAGTATLRVRLTAKGLARLRRAHRVRAKLTLVLRDAAGNRRTVRRTVTLRS